MRTYVRTGGLKLKSTRVSFDKIDNYISSEIFDSQENEQSKISKYPVLKELLDENLTAKQKCYIMLYYRDGLTMEEIADKCGVGKSTVSKTILRGRKRMLSGLKKQCFRRLLGEREDINEHSHK